MALKPIGIKLKQVPSKCMMRYISEKKKKKKKMRSTMAELIFLIAIF